MLSCIRLTFYGFYPPRGIATERRARSIAYAFRQR